MSQNLNEAIELYDRMAQHIGTCGDGGCLVLKPQGMHTNGGCRCFEDKYKSQRMMIVGNILRKALKGDN